MLTIQGVHKAFGSQEIFDGADLQMNSQDRFALVGPNGAGKSTLFRLILGEHEPDAGVLTFPQHLQVGYLPQETTVLENGTVLEECLKGLPAEASERDQAEAKKILMGLGFRTTDFERPVSALSGGWRMRVAIARLLLQSPDLLLLDEPTNHLDLEALLWFQEYLQRWRGAVLFISHDRAFVNALATTIVEVRGGKLYRYPGNYERFLDLRRLEEEQLVAAYKRQQKEIEEAEIFISRFRAQASKAPQVQSRIKMLEKMERIEIPPEAKKVKIHFPQPARAGVRILSLRNIHKSYDDLKVYEGLDFELDRGQKMVFVGHNGAGKSTLLKMLAGVLPYEKGERVLGLNAQVGYYAQHRIDMLSPERTVLQEAMDTKRMNPDLFIRTVLGTFLFRDNAVYKKVGVLSGGEKSRVALVKLLLDPPNVLLLDEPTTHLDMASVEALVEALKDFEGTLCFISHDLYFINALADHVVHVDHGKITVYPGNYEYFQRRQAQQSAEPGPAVPSRAPSPSAGRAPQAPGGVKSSQDDMRRFQEAEKARVKARKKLNARLRALDEELGDLKARLGSIFIQSDYQKLMELDQAVKAMEQEQAQLKEELTKLL